MKNFFIALLIIICSGSAVFAKSLLRQPIQSVELLKSLTTEGQAIRQNDILIEKADVSEDTLRVKELKQIYNDEYNELYIKKIPDVEQNRGTIE